jgi:hypothetical protein
MARLRQSLSCSLGQVLLEVEVLMVMIVMMREMMMKRTKMMISVSIDLVCLLFVVQFSLSIYIIASWIPGNPRGF